MLGTVTPLGERGRGNQAWGRVAVLYLVSAAGAAASLGALLGLAGRAVASLPLEGPNALQLTSAVAAAAVGVDVARRASVLPHFRRQVSHGWLGRLRPSVCAIGFGWQLGLGFTTHLISAATYAAFACAALTGSAGAGAAIGASFGLARGGLVYLVRGVHDPAELARLHQRVLSKERWWRNSLRTVEIGIAAAGAAIVLAGYV